MLVYTVLSEEFHRISRHAADFLVDCLAQAYVYSSHSAVREGYNLLLYHSEFPVQVLSQLTDQLPVTWLASHEREPGSSCVVSHGFGLPVWLQLSPADLSLFSLSCQRPGLMHVPENLFAHPNMKAPLRGSAVRLIQLTVVRVEQT